MTYKITVCDDERTANQQIADYLSQFQKDNNIRFQIFHFSSGKELLEKMPRDTAILFLDIQMNGISGIETARELRKNGYDLFIFFVTANITFALEGYDVHAFAFLQKPLQYPQFYRNLQDALHQLEKKSRAVLHVQKNASVDIVRCDDILYVEVYRHLTVIVTRTGSLEYGTPLGEIENQIGKFGFFRCHKSYLVNMKHISGIRQTDLLIDNGFSIPLSKHRRQDFLSAYTLFIGGGL